MIVRTDTINLNSDEKPFVLVLTLDDIIRILNMPRKEKGQKYYLALFPEDVPVEVARDWMQKVVPEVGPIVRLALLDPEKPLKSGPLQP